MCSVCTYGLSAGLVSPCLRPVELGWDLTRKELDPFDSLFNYGLVLFKSSCKFEVAVKRKAVILEVVWLYVHQDSQTFSLMDQFQMSALFIVCCDSRFHWQLYKMYILFLTSCWSL